MTRGSQHSPDLNVGSRVFRAGAMGEICDASFDDDSETKSVPVPDQHLLLVDRFSKRIICVYNMAPCEASKVRGVTNLNLFLSQSNTVDNVYS